MYKLNYEMLYNEAYVFRITSENAKEFARLFSSLHGREYAGLLYLVCDAIIDYPEEDNPACLRYIKQSDKFGYADSSYYREEGYTVIDAMQLFIAIEEEEEFEASDMDISVMM